MNLDYSTLDIGKVIIHEIPQHRKSETGSSPILSEVESPITNDLRIFLREKITESAGSSSACRVEFVNPTDSPIPVFVSEYLVSGKTPDFISMSQEIAKYLYKIQTGVNPTGLLAVMMCELEDKPALGVLKIEREEGLRFQQDEVGGKKTFSLEHIRQLMLTRKTKLFKIGLFIAENRDLQSIHGIVCDQQRGFTEKGEVADFFLRKFLGCKLYDDPPITTKRFMEATQEFVDKNIDDPIKKSTYCTHLVSELTSNRQVIRPKKVAEDYFDVKDRKAYIDHLESKGVPISQFDKDTERIKKRLQKMLVEFVNGVQIISPAEGYEEMVKLTALDDGRTRAEVVDELKSVKTK